MCGNHSGERLYVLFFQPFWRTVVLFCWCIEFLGICDMLSFIQNSGDVIVLMLFFGASIFIHELGHFLVAIKLGLVVDTFSIGFGPAIWKKKINGIDFKICWIPLGGYVALPQLDPTGMSTVQGVSEDGKEVEHRVLPNISPARKIAVSVAGAAGNVILAVVFAMIIWLSPGAITYKGAPVIARVDESSAVYASGLRGGDEIIAINHKPVATWYDVSMEMLLIGASTNVDLIVLSGKEQRSISAPMVKHEGAEIPVFEGITRQPTPCILKSIVSDSSADEAGLLENDLVKTIDGVEVMGADAFSDLIDARVDQNVAIVVERGGEEITSTVIPKYQAEKTGRAVIDVMIMEQSDQCVLSFIGPNGPAFDAGLQKNDIVKEFDGKKVGGVSDFITLVDKRGDQRVSIIVERDGENLELSVVPGYTIQRVSIGAQPTSLILPWMQEKQPLAQLRSDAMRIVRLLKALVTPKEAKHAAGGMGGPVMIFAALWMAIKISMFNAIGFLRFLNINLAILNLLPLPVLDGGHVMFALWEGITKRKVHAKVVNILVNAFAVLLIGVFLILTFKDVDRIFPGVKRIFSREDKTECVTNEVETNVVEDVAE